jgi:hypothetical protein
MVKLDLSQQFYNLKRDILIYSSKDYLKRTIIILKPNSRVLNMTKHLHYKLNAELFFTTFARTFTSLETN